MSTHCQIGIVLPNKKVNSIYCHFDGYPSATGAGLLKDKYNIAARVKNLVNQGAIDSLEDRVPLDDETVFCVNKNEKEFMKQHMEDGPAEYVYLFKAGKWYWATSDTKLKRLLKRDCMENNED